MGTIFTCLRITLIACHLAATALAGIGPIMAIVARGFGRAPADSAVAAASTLLRWSLQSLVAGFLIGATALVLLWCAGETRYFDAIDRFPQRTWIMLTAEGVFSLVLYGICVAAWGRLARRPWLLALLAFAGSTNILYHFPPAMIAVAELMQAPTLAPEVVVDHDAFLRLSKRPEVLTKVTHFWGMAVVVGGAALAQAAVAARGNRLMRSGAWVAAAGVCLQGATGIWTLVALPQSASRGLLGDTPLATLLFAAALAASLGTLVTYLAIALNDEPSTHPASVRRGSLFVLATITLMAAAAHAFPSN